MTFEELWIDIEKIHILPGKIINQIPHILASDTKKQFAQMSVEDAIHTVSEAVEQINREGIEIKDALTSKKIMDQSENAIAPAHYSKEEEWRLLMYGERKERLGNGMCAPFINPNIIFCGPEIDKQCEDYQRLYRCFYLIS